MDYEAERQEEERLRRQIQYLVSEINREARNNELLQMELSGLITEVMRLIKSTQAMDRDVNKEMEHMAGKVSETEIGAKAVNDAINDFKNSYFIFKNISSATKNITQYSDEYHTKFWYYDELRRITLGYVIGLDTHICSSENMRKKVEKAYLQNTEYWLAYCIMATMLWANNEQEAAARALQKGLFMNYLSSCLYFLLINLRFARVDSAKKWYMNYLDKVDMNNLGEEWQYLLQAYLSGAFGGDRDFQSEVSKCFAGMLEKLEVTQVDYGRKVIRKAAEYADAFIHTTDMEYETLQKTCSEYIQIKELLSEAEKNAAMAKYFSLLLEKGGSSEDLPQRIENVLYSLINDYDAEEKAVLRNLWFNEMIVKAKGDIGAAQKSFDLQYGQENKNTFDDLLTRWAFANENSSVDIDVQKFSISFLKKWINKGFEQFAEKYRAKEKEKYDIMIDGFSIECSENDIGNARDSLDKHYEKTKLKDILKDKLVLIYSGVCLASLLTLVIMAIITITSEFAPAALVIGVLLGLVGSFLLWRRLVTRGAMHREKKKLGFKKLQDALNELGAWRKAYKEEDAKISTLEEVINNFA